MNGDKENGTCDHVGCSEIVRESDRELKPETKKYCDMHGREIDAIIQDGSAADIMRWYVRSLIDLT